MALGQERPYSCWTSSPSCPIGKIYHDTQIARSDRRTKNNHKIMVPEQKIKENLRVQNYCLWLFG